MSSLNFAQPDVTLRLDFAGVIQRAAVSTALSSEGVVDWVGRPWAETVSGGEQQVTQMIEAARTTGVSSFHQLRQRFQSGVEVVVEYTTVRLGGEEGLIAIGRVLAAVADLRSRLVAAQASMERESWKLRAVETRYRLLFEASDQPVVLIDAADLRIVEQNPAATRALNVSGDRDLLPELRSAERASFSAMLVRVREQGRAPGIVVHLGANDKAWLVRASLVAAEPSPVFVLQLSPASATSVAPVSEPARRLRIDDLLARLPEGFVILDASGHVLRANQAFIDLVELPSCAAAIGQPLVQWLSGPTAAASVLLLQTTVRDGGVSRDVRVTIQGERGTPSEVVLSAAGDVDENPSFVGVLVHRVDAAGKVEAAVPALPPEAIAKAMMRETVMDAVASVERRCAEAAARITAARYAQHRGTK